MSEISELIEKNSLGVGAVYEPAKGDARDVARLKGRLVQKKRDADAGPFGAVNKGDSDEEDDEEDSRAKVFAKKINAQQNAVDKFSSKAERKAAASTASRISVNTVDPNVTSTDKYDKHVGDNLSSMPSSSAASNDNLTNGFSRASTSASISSPTSSSMPPPSNTTKPKTPKTNPDTHHADNIFSPNRTPIKSNGALLFNQPTFGILGADHQGQDDSDIGDEGHEDTIAGNTVEVDSMSGEQVASSTTHKRKRKRRKKKHHPASDAETQPTPASASPSSGTLHLQLPKPTLSPSSRGESITPSESVASLATGPPPTISTLSSRATSPGASSVNGVGSSQEKGFVLGPAAEEVVRSSPKTVKGSNFLSPRKKSGPSSRRKQLYEKIAAKELQNALLRKMEETNTNP